MKGLTVSKEPMIFPFDLSLEFDRYHIPAFQAVKVEIQDFVFLPAVFKRFQKDIHIHAARLRCGGFFIRAGILYCTVPCCSPSVNGPLYC